MASNNEKITQLISSSVASLMLGCWKIYQHFPPSLQASFQSKSSEYSYKLYNNYISPYVDITFEAFTDDDRFDRSQIVTTIRRYLSDKSSMEAKSMKADYIKDGKSLILSLGDDEEVLDDYKGVKVSWVCCRPVTNLSSDSSSSHSGSEHKRYYKLIFHKRDRKFILDTYLPYVLEEGEAVATRKRTRKLYTNHKSSPRSFVEPNMWSHVEFNHPATFDKLAMKQTEKQKIIDNLLWFKSSKDYYAQIGKPWKRGYLLYGPPGTGKSTLVAAIANFLDYDIYDLELTSVSNNMQLRSLLTEIRSKSVVLVEDIDCSLDLTGQRKSKKAENEEKKTNPIEKKMEKENRGNEVTLSGLLNIIDGIWSTYGEERLFVFTTNYIDDLDPALIRRGRMDLHIELSYCGIEAFKILAKTYLRVDSHPSFESIGKLLEEVEMSPADIAENLMPRSMDASTDDCLQNVINALEYAKVKKKAET